MKTIAIPALAAALALAACDSGADDAAVEGDTATMEGDTTMMPAPTATETTVVTDSANGTRDTGDRVTIGRDGVTADVGDSNTRVRANVDRDPSLTVETD